MTKEGIMRREEILEHILIAIYIGFTVIGAVYYFLKDYDTLASYFGTVAAINMIGLISHKLSKYKNKTR